MRGGGEDLRTSTVSLRNFIEGVYFKIFIGEKNEIGKKPDATAEIIRFFIPQRRSVFVLRFVFLLGYLKDLVQTFGIWSKSMRLPAKANISQIESIPILFCIGSTSRAARSAVRKFYYR
jgi:hypothetical protein